MTAQEFLDRADALAAEATEGLWGTVLAWDSSHGTNYGVDARLEDDIWPVVRGGMEEDAEFIAAARTLVPAMSAALRAVLALHSLDSVPDPEWQGQGWCQGCGWAWPCTTERAITDALDGAL